MSKAGKRDRRILIQKPNASRSGPLNEMQDNWTNLVPGPDGKVWAEKRTPTATERLMNSERGAEATAVFETPFSNLVRETDATCRVLHDDKTWEILGTLEIGRREGIQILAVARNEGGLPEFDYGNNPDYVPSLDFSDARNSMYIPLF